MPDLSQAMNSPGLWLAVAAIVLNIAARPIATAIKPKDEEGRNRIVPWAKTLSLVLAISGFIIVVKTVLF